MAYKYSTAKGPSAAVPTSQEDLLYELILYYREAEDKVKFIDGLSRKQRRLLLKYLGKGVA